VLEIAHELGDRPVVVTGGGGYTAENVTRTLARAGMLVLGQPMPPLNDRLPEDWREEYRTELEAEPPLDFGDLAPTGRSTWSHHRTEKLVEQLEVALGQPFRPEHGPR
jgi:hypothetical protein